MPNLIEAAIDVAVAIVDAAVDLAALIPFLGAVLIWAVILMERV